MKKLLLFTFINLIIVASWAQQVSISEATNAASQFLQSQGKSLKKCASVVTENSDTLLYIFNADNAFVVVSGDKSTPPVLAFSDHQLYNSEDVIPPVQMWLDNYKQQIASLKKTERANGTIHPSWTRLLTQQNALRIAEEIDPLMKSHWGQGEYYNYYCPRDVEGENNHVVTGCVATAMAQLIYYFRFPETGIGSYSYLDSTYGVQSADYGATTYNYEAMCNDPRSINTEIAKLMYHCGVGVDMVYGPDGSGMYNHSAARVLRTFFKYSRETEYLFRDSTTLNWDSVIVAHLNRQIPMYYAGWSVPNINGHGYICDGYKMMDSCYYFHFNFGWNGSYDSYYYTDHLNVGGSNFNLVQELIVNAYPDTTQYQYPVETPLTGSKLLTSPSGSFSDGAAGSATYRPNMDYTWIIRPGDPDLNYITLDVTFDIAEGDSIFITIPNDTSEVLTAEYGLYHYTVYGANSNTEILVRFVTDDTLEAAGFRVSYASMLMSHCVNDQIFTTPTGTIVDGSGPQYYASFENCRKRIVLPSYSAITLHVVDFDLEDGHDFLHIYKYPIKNENLLMSLTGRMYDTTLLFNEKRLMLSFETDERNNASGFEIEYAGGYVGVTDRGNDAVEVWPNPASDYLCLQSESPLGQIDICDLRGRVVYTQMMEDVAGSMNIASLPAGIYLLKVQNDNGVTVKKIIKK